MFESIIKSTIDSFFGTYLEISDNDLKQSWGLSVIEVTLHNIRFKDTIF